MKKPLLETLRGHRLVAPTANAPQRRPIQLSNDSRVAIGKRGLILKDDTGTVRRLVVM
jgi:hypothetical protein